MSWMSLEEWVKKVMAEDGDTPANRAFLLEYGRGKTDSEEEARQAVWEDHVALHSKEWVDDDS